MVKILSAQICLVMMHARWALFVRVKSDKSRVTLLGIMFSDPVMQPHECPASEKVNIAQTEFGLST